MSSIKDFILEDISVLEETAEVYFPQFTAPFKVRSITANEFKEIRKACEIKTRNKKTGQVVTETDADKMLDLFIINGVVEPDLANAQLQKAYGVMNSADCARKMLKAGQFNELADKIQALSGFDVDEAVEEIKN